jgi:hypothetical protein
MSEISAMASSAIAMQLSRMQDQISMSLLRTNAKAEQALADMVAQNARQIEAVSNNLSGGSIDISV